MQFEREDSETIVNLIVAAVVVVFFVLLVGVISSLF